MVHPQATRILEAHLLKDGADPSLLISELTREFYRTHGDDYDFLFVLPKARVMGRAAGRLVTVRSDARPWGGQGAFADPSFGSAARLKAVIGLDASPEGNGPALHELFHYWGVFLDARFGFGRGAGSEYGPHWGFASTYGQLGGFPRESLQCAGGGLLPCLDKMDATGRVQLEVHHSFGPFANGGDSLAYSPLELYLMGLLPANEVPSTLVLDGARIDGVEGSFIRVSASGMHEVPVAAIAAVHGVVPAATQTTFRAAFVVASEQPPTAAERAGAAFWAQRLAGAISAPPGISFEQATGGRARLDVRP